MTETPQTPAPQEPAPAQAGPGNALGIASLILGIVAAVIALIPVCGAIAIAPAVVGLILGIINVKGRGKANLPKGVGMAGIILNVAALLFIVVYLVIFAAAAPKVGEAVREGIEALPTQPAT